MNIQLDMGILADRGRFALSVHLCASADTYLAICKNCLHHAWSSVCLCARKRLPSFQAILDPKATKTFHRTRSESFVSVTLVRTCYNLSSTNFPAPELQKYSVKSCQVYFESIMVKRDISFLEMF